MVLPLLLSLGGSALAGAGMLGSMSPLLAGALGSGIGAFAETGDIKDGLSAGIGSFLGGSLLGKLGGGASEAALGAGAEAVGGAATDAATQAATDAATGSIGTQGGGTGLLSGILQPQAVPGSIPGPATEGLFKAGFQQGNAGQGLNFAQDPSSYAAQQRFGAGVGTLMRPEVLGAGIGGLASMPPEEQAKRQAPNIPQAPSPGASAARPGPGYRPGYDPEFDYRVPTNYAEGGIVGLSKGKEQDKALVEAAVAALNGQSPNPEEVLGAFLARFGEEALRDLTNRVKGGGGMTKGPGDGTSDSIPASVDGQEQAALSDGEFVVPADVVSGLGNGSSDAGAQALYQMLDQVRAKKSGSPAQPPRINPAQAMPA